MPIYEYKCGSCGKKVEYLQKINDELPEECPYCGAKNSLKKLVSNTSFELKGTGWYATDYKNKSSAKGESETPSKEESKTTGKGESTKCCSKLCQ